MIPLVDLKANYLPLAKEIAQGFERVCNDTAFILGADVKEFEKEYAAFIGAKHCIGVANGTDALELALRAAGLQPGDEVLVPTNSFIASALAVARAGGQVKLVDCDDDYLIDLESCAKAVTPRTKFIMPVHLFGQCAPMQKVADFAKAHALAVVEDAAQAQGAKQNNRAAGTFGIAAGTSFYPGKNLGAYGDGGAITTDDDAVAQKLRALRNYGSEVKYHHPETGFNSRLDTLQAVVLRAKLKHLSDYNAQRRAAAERYQALLKDVRGVGLPRTASGNEHIWHIYAVRVPKRDAVLHSLQAQKIGAGIHYPVPIHLQGAFKSLGHKAGDFPQAEAAANEMISLPMYPELTAAQAEQVVGALRKAL
ncbi:MAG: DegT/DnrJ/EryC1/StrS family aminotransferase [Myxococcaceae bacterium]|nr:DegT/DnrJ/EryC1/StrS family aminotransferase [Myxococcaceae bacterium]